MPCAFDIEDSSFYNQDGEKTATMYTWQFAINFVVFRGRTWKEFKDLINTINDELWKLQEPTYEYRLIVYVHFLDHEFQFMRKLFKWSNVFSRKTRSPIYAVTDCIEFRDSYILSGKSLANLSKDLRDTTYSKKVGDLNYNVIRGCETWLSEKENQYCDYDVLTLNEYIKEKIEDEGGNISKIPLTNTGYVRREVRKRCLPSDRIKNVKYFKMIHLLTLEVPEYRLLDRAFQGGYTHANPAYIGDVIEGVESIDFTSSYPAVLLAFKYPMSRGQQIKVTSHAMFKRLMYQYCCIFTIKFNNIRQRDNAPDSIISRSRCSNIENGVFNNGRVYSADCLTTTITEVDYNSIRNFYTWDSEQIGLFYIYKKDYLPKPIIESVLDFYNAKTTLKGVPGEEVNYMLKKGMLNSIYGMMVTSIIKSLIKCSESGDWTGEEVPDINEAIDKYNKNKRRFLYYPWGVYVTAYARRNLFSGVLEFNEDYIYSDTDSIKCINIKDHMNYIKSYNKWITSQIRKCLEHYKLPLDSASPLNIKGVSKPLGVWDWETEGNPYIRFKTLGAKRYIYEQSDGLHITIAGVSKKMGSEYLSGQKDPFKAFEDGMTIDTDHSGKLTHTYLDYEQEGDLKDYRGQIMQYHELSSVHLERSSYEMSIAAEFRAFLNGYYTEVVYD